MRIILPFEIREKYVKNVQKEHLADWWKVEIEITNREDWIRLKKTMRNKRGTF